MTANVLHTITGLNTGGAEHMLARFLGELDRSSFSCTVLSLLPPGLLRGPVERRSSGVISIGMTQQPRPRDVVRLAQMIGRSTPDLLHGWMHHGNLAATLGSIFSCTFAPVIWSVHHSITNLQDEKPFTRRLLRLSARLSSRPYAISYCSRVAADDHERLGYDPRRRVVIPNGTDCAAFKPSPEAPQRLREMLAIPPERILVGHVARHHLMKDQASLVRAIAKLAADGRDVQGVFVGDGHVDGPVRQIAEELGIGDRITTTGIRDDVADLLPGFDVFALSSAWGEAFPLSVGEAMACGVPAVVTDVGDCAWLVGPTGVTVPPSDHDALAGGLATLIDLGPHGRRSLGERARRRIVENFSLPLYVRRHLDLYEQAMEGRHRKMAS